MGLEAYDTVAAADAGRMMKLPDPITGKETGEFIRYRGTDSGIYKKTMAEFSSLNKKLGRDLTDEEREEQDIDALSRMVVEWKITENGKEVPFSYEEAKRVHRKYPSIKRRGTRFVFTELNFLGTASASS
jgi:hypothetical protein